MISNTSPLWCLPGISVSSKSQEVTSWPLALNASLTVAEYSQAINIFIRSIIPGMVGVCQEKFKKIFPSWCVAAGLGVVCSGAETRSVGAETCSVVCSGPLAPLRSSNILVLGREGERGRAI